jgi:cholest-4-en-3-one 26-monooxygenase
MLCLVRRCSSFVALTSALLCIPAIAPTLAQTPGSSRISGVVSDSGGVPREAATVRATNNATGVTRSTTTRADGAYTITGLSSGTYTVSASLIGFRRATRTDVRVDQDVTVDLTLQALPLQAITELLGVPQEDRRKIFNWSNEMVGYDDPDFEVDSETAAAEMLGYSMELAEERTRCPMDDIVTKLVTANIDGQGLTSDEFGFFVIMLAVAGNETTRNAISHGMNAFLDNPDQWELYKQGRHRTAPDEIVRWATPVVSFQRTALRDTQIGGVDIAKGQRVVMFYASANQDTEVFDHPERFDITRDPNPHLGFGGTGAHHCIGANLARLEIDLIFNAIADHMPNITKVAEPRRLRSGWINGIKELRVRYS